MHLHFERNANAKCDCAILSLTWMGKVPDELPEDEGWKLNRTNYYQEGWLATGNVRGIVGVTFTTSHCKKSAESPLRTNYNLRGHRSEVILVKWNEPYQKLASCDSSGIIFVWIKYEGRWSIELINDRNTPVTHFAWSHDGRMALICYQDGFVLVGSVAGQRYWSSMLNLDSTITCGIWTPDDLHVYFGTSHGGLVVMDVHGAMVAQVALAQAPITGMAWSCEKFKMEEADDVDQQSQESGPLVLAVSVSTGHIFLMKSYDDLSLVNINTGLGGPLCMEWSNSRQLLAVAGVANHSDHGDYTNMLKCYSDSGVLLYSTPIPFTQSPVSALTWGHNDKRLFIATGGVVHIAWVSRRVASLQLLSRLQVAASLPLGESSVKNLPLPPRLKHLIGNLFTQTIRCCVPEMRGIREFVSRAPVNGTRLHCTMIRHDDDHVGTGTCYTLYLEYLGGLVPLLKGKRTSKIRPEFVIFDPQVDDKSSEIIQKIAVGSDTSDTEKEEGCGGSPRPQRRRRKRHKSPTEPTDDLSYVDTLSENARLVEVTSNIWGTKFKIHGLADCLPANLGQVTYKTSLLHLQPRQMSLVMTELSDDVLLLPDPTFNPNVFSEDEEDPTGPHQDFPHHPPIIAPMTPKNLRQPSNSRFLGESSGSPRFVHARPHVQRNISLQRHVQGEIPTLSAALQRNKLMQDRLQKILDAKERKNPLQRNLSFLEAQNNDVQVDVEPSTSRTQPSPNCDTHLTTYQSSDAKSIEDESSYVDCNLSDVINFCENYKVEDRLKRPKLRADRAETSFLNYPIYPLDGYKFTDEESGERITRSCSVGFLDNVDTGLVPCDLTLSLLKKDSPKRLVLIRKKHPPKTKSSLSLDSSDLLILRRPLAKDFAENAKPPAASSPHCVVERLPEAIDPEPLPKSPRMPRSQPVSPAMGKKAKRHQSASPIRRHILNSPLLRRRRTKSKAESSDEEVALSADEAFTSSKTHYKDLETFQKAQLRQKLKRGKVSDGYTPRVKELVMHNKAPIWNENSQVYQLDFGGRVTQESAKNFQIEFKGKQVMQFGRIDGNAYTLDFQYPFSVLQAFAVALANVTQRLK